MNHLNATATTKKINSSKHLHRDCNNIYIYMFLLSYNILHKNVQKITSKRKASMINGSSMYPSFDYTLWLYTILTIFYYFFAISPYWSQIKKKPHITEIQINCTSWAADSNRPVCWCQLLPESATPSSQRVLQSLHCVSGCVWGDWLLCSPHTPSAPNA